MVLDDDRCSLYGLKHSSDADTATQVHILAYLGATAHGGPRVNHCTTVHVCTDVHIRRHHDGSGGQIGSVACHSRGNHAHRAVGIMFFERYFVVVFHGPRLEGFHALQGEVEQYSFLHPFVDTPVTVGFLRHANLAAVKLCHCLQYGFFCLGTFQQ